MALRDFPLRASIAVSDITRAVAFYEGTLGLQALESGPSASIPDASRVYGSGGGPALNVYQSPTAGKSPATLATWYVDDIDHVAPPPPFITLLHPSSPYSTCPLFPAAVRLDFRHDHPADHDHPVVHRPG